MLVQVSARVCTYFTVNYVYKSYLIWASCVIFYTQYKNTGIDPAKGIGGVQFNHGYGLWGWDLGYIYYTHFSFFSLFFFGQLMNFW